MNLNKMDMPLPCSEAYPYQLKENIYIKDIISKTSELIIYSGYQTKGKAKIPVVIKEILPKIIEMRMSRSPQGELLAPDYFEDYFERIKLRILDQNKLASKILEMNNETWLKKNNTFYSIKEIIPGKILAYTAYGHEKEKKLEELKAIVDLMLGLIALVKKLENKNVHLGELSPGILYINKKIEIWDFGKSFVQGKKEAPVGVMFNSNFSPRELKNWEVDNIGAWSEVYTCTALYFYLLTGLTWNQISGSRSRKIDCQSLEEILKKTLGNNQRFYKINQKIIGENYSRDTQKRCQRIEDLEKYFLSFKEILEKNQ